MQRLSPSTSPLLARAAWVLGLFCLISMLAVIERSPVPSLDEIYLTSVSKTVAQGADRSPRLVPPPEWFDDYEKLYGPVFFYVEAPFIRVLGLSMFSSRLVCWIGTLLLCGATAWLVLLADGSVEFAAVAFAVMALTPELSALARNGRMDSLALTLELAGIGGLVSAWRSPARALRWSLFAGVCWALAVTTTPRTLPLLAGLAVASPLVLGREDRRAVILSLSCVFLGPIVGIGLWAARLGLSLIGWAWWMWDGVKDDYENIALPGHERLWGMGFSTALTPIALVLATAGVSLVAWKLCTRRQVPAGSRRTLWYLVWATTFNTLFYLIVANFAFVVSEYFVTPMLVVLLMGTAKLLRANTRAYQWSMALWIVVALAFGAHRVAKHVEVWQTWQLRDPQRLLTFIRQWVPPGSIIFGDDQYYYYAIENAGSTYRTFYLEKTGAGDAHGPRFRRQAVPAGKQAFLIWPVGDPNAPFPPWFDCAKPDVVAAFESSDEPIGIERTFSFAFFPYLHGYPKTILYRVPPGCPLVAN